MYYLYLLKSKNFDQIYVGSTNNLRIRFDLHNSGKVFSTKRYMPWELEYYEAYKTEKLARIREKNLKYSGNAIRELKKRAGLYKSGKSGAGFTLIEVMIVLGLIALIGGLGLFVSFDLYKSYSFRSERNTVVSSIQKARGQALANINQTKHGAHYDSGSNCILYSKCYVIFEGSSFVAGAASNIEIQASSAVAVTWSNDIVFNQLDGASNAVTITLTQDANSATISTNNAGRIEW